MQETEQIIKKEEVKPHMPEGLAKMMKSQGYHFVGKHSATKICNYTSDSLKGGASCYKHRFYGIRSWRCIQATPAIGCNLACTFCWRIIPEEVGFNWNELNAVEQWDSPESIVEGLVNEHKRIVSGYKGNEKVDMKRWNESNDPAHVAFSLTGEPLFYPKMNELIKAFHDRGISTFVVTNGTMLNALKALKEMPTQLYVSIQAPNKELYGKITRAKNLTATWENFLGFLEYFSTLPTRKVFRLTLVKKLSMEDVEGYCELIKKGKPQYVEVKGFSFVGGARNEKRGLSYEQMPRTEDIKEFAKAIAEKSGYIFTDYHEKSAVALLSIDKKAASERVIKFKK